MLNARDHYYHAAYAYGEMEHERARKVAKAGKHVEQAEATDKHVKANLQKLLDLTREMEAELGKTRRFKWKAKWKV